MGPSRVQAPFPSTLSRSCPEPPAAFGDAGFDPFHRIAQVVLLDDVIALEDGPGAVARHPHVSLTRQPALVAHVTGKFVMHVVADADQDLAFAVEVELAPGSAAPPADLADQAAASIHAALLRLDPEFAAYVPAERQRPRVTLTPGGRSRVVPGRGQASPLAALTLPRGESAV
jgi:hypothetical protein